MLRPVFIVLLFAMNVSASEYLMPKLVLEKSIEDQVRINLGSTDHCKEKGSIDYFGFIPVDKDGFEAIITCAFQCHGNQKTTETLKQNFDTEKIGMKRGDGNLWASLSTTIEMWSRESCLEKAQRQCGSLDKIEAFELPLVTSGNWILDKKLKCSKDAPVVLSPFEKSLKTAPQSSEIKSEKLNPLSLKPTWNKITPLGIGSRNNYKMPKKCKIKVTGTFCYGDCITLDEGPYKELLSSPTPLGEDQYTFCADELVAKLKNKKLSSDVIDFYCEDYFLTILKEVKATGLTCASSRIGLDCSEIKSLVK